MGGPGVWLLDSSEAFVSGAFPESGGRSVAALWRGTAPDSRSKKKHSSKNIAPRNSGTYLCPGEFHSKVRIGPGRVSHICESGVAAAGARPASSPLSAAQAAGPRDLGALTHLPNNNSNNTPWPLDNAPCSQDDHDCVTCVVRPQRGSMLCP